MNDLEYVADRLRRLAQGSVLCPVHACYERDDPDGGRFTPGGTHAELLLRRAVPVALPELINHALGGSRPSDELARARRVRIVIHSRSPDFKTVGEIASEAIVPINDASRVLEALVVQGEAVEHPEWKGYYSVPKKEALPLRHGMYYDNLAPPTYSYVDSSRYASEETK